MKYEYTKEQIDSEVEENWRELGYSAKPDKFIALSFDDGPCGSTENGGTAAMLAKLDELRVKATFFVIGENVRNCKAAASAIFNGGHEIGNHSDSHGYLGSAAEDAIAKEIDAASEAIKEITGNYPTLFRAPFLNHGAALSRLCLERGLPLIDGSVHDDWDGTGHTPASVRNSVLANPQDGGIIVLHDNNTSKGDTMAALPEIIAELRAKGFWILPVSQLAAVKGKTLEAGTRYGSIN